MYAVVGVKVKFVPPKLHSSFYLVDVAEHLVWVASPREKLVFQVEALASGKVATITYSWD